MSEKLVKTQYDFLWSVVHSAGETLGKSRKQVEGLWDAYICEKAHIISG
jgi:hypothetical protein